MFENPRRGRQAKNLTKNVPKFLDLKSSSEKVFSENWRWVLLFFFFVGTRTCSYPVECKHSAVARGLQDFNCSCSVSYSRRVLGIPEWVRISNALCKYIVLSMVHSKHFFFSFLIGFNLPDNDYLLNCPDLKDVYPTQPIWPSPR